MEYRSFSSRLSWRIIGIVSVIFLISFIVVAIVSHLTITEEAVRSTRYILHGTVNEIEKPLTEVEISTKMVSAYMTPVTDNPEMLQMIASRTVELSDLIVGCAIIFVHPDGSCDTSRKSEFSYMGEGTAQKFVPNSQQLHQIVKRWAEKPVATKDGSWTPPIAAPYNPSVVITTYCYPLVDSALNVYAIVATDLPIGWMQDKVENLRPYENSITTLFFDEEHVLGIKESDSDLVKRFVRALEEDKEYDNMVSDLRENKDSLRRRVGKGGETSIMAYAPLHNGWMISILCPYRDVLRQSSRSHVSLMIVGIIGLFILFFTCRREIRRMTRPVTELAVSAQNMARGNFNAKLPEITSHDEMLRLHDSFLYMQDSLNDYIGQLKTTRNDKARMESELDVARNIQKGMLSTEFPPNLHAMLTPAREVGGDLYAFMQDGDQLSFSIGDVSGKGVPAALTMAVTCTAIRVVGNSKQSFGEPLDKLVSRINHIVTITNSNNMFVTLFTGRINLKTRRMDFCNAGHNSLVILPPAGKPYFLKAKANLTVGLFDDFPYVPESIDLDPGTRIVAYTDGVTEAENADKELYGDDRLLETVSQLAPEMDDKAAVEYIYQSVSDFADGNPQNDDITIMCIRI